MDIKQIKQELEYKLRFYGLKEMWTYNENGKSIYLCGCVSIDDKVGLRYNQSYCAHKWISDEIAFRKAHEQIDEYNELIKSFKSDAVVERDIEHVKNFVSFEDVVFVGTLDGIFVKIKNINRHLRYINGEYWCPKNNDTKKEYMIWEKWIHESRSFYLYYGNGIVD